MKRTKRFPLMREQLLQRKNLTNAEIRFMVANYYQSQAMRKRMDMQIRHLGDKPELIITSPVARAFSAIEIDIAVSFEKLLVSPVAKWIRSQRGIGAIITAGLLGHIDITKAPTVGHIWRFAGLDPTLKWEKGQKRPFNADLKQICWHMGQCFMKQSNDPDCFYGRLYRKRKEYEIARNEAGGNAERAKEFKVSPTTTKAVKDKLKEGKMPDFNIDARARRYAVKIFLSHLHYVMYWDHFKQTPPKPYALTHLDHAHLIDAPHQNLIPGMPPMSEWCSQKYSQAAE